MYKGRFQKKRRCQRKHKARNENVFSNKLNGAVLVGRLCRVEYITAPTNILHLNIIPYGIRTNQ
jgi:hypothetical protein